VDAVRDIRSFLDGQDKFYVTDTLRRLSGAITSSTSGGTYQLQAFESVQWPATDIDTAVTDAQAHIGD